MTKTGSFTEKKRGFTLLELCVVLIIVALITGMAMTSGVAVLATARQSATEQKMRAIEAALQQYRETNDRLPCPADLTIPDGATNSGVEGANSGTCTGGTPAANFSATAVINPTFVGVEGALPVTTLGLANDFMVDGWGNRLRYVVDASVTAIHGFTDFPSNCNFGAIEIKDRNGMDRTSGAVYALISHGENGHGAYTRNGVITSASSINTDERTNCHCDAAAIASAYAPAYVMKSATTDITNPLNGFDDIVSYKERWQLAAPWEKAKNCIGMYVADKDNYRIQIFSPGGHYISQFGSSGNGDGQFGFAEFIALDPYNNIYIADRNNNRIEKFDKTGSFLSQFGTAGSGNGQFNNPVGLAVNSSGNIFVADFANNRVQKFDAAFNYITQIGTGYGSGNGQMNGPYDVAIDASGAIFVVENGNSRVQKFDSNGYYLSQFGSAGSGNGQFNGPTSINFDSNNNRFVCDAGNNRIEKFDSNGNYILQFGNSLLNNPISVKIDAQDNVWVTDGQNNVLRKFTNAGVYLNTYLSAGSGNGQLQNPQGIVLVK